MDKPPGIHADQQEGLALDEREGTPAPPPDSVSCPPINDLNGGDDFGEAFGRGCRLQCPIGIGQRHAEPLVIFTDQKQRGLITNRQVLGKLSQSLLWGNRTLAGVMGPVDHI